MRDRLQLNDNVLKTSYNVLILIWVEQSSDNPVKDSWIELTKATKHIKFKKTLVNF